MGDPEEVLRRGTQQLAAEAEATPEVVGAIVQRARAGVARRRRSAATAVGAAAAVVLLLAGVAVVRGTTRDADRSHAPAATRPSDRVAPEAPAGYRTEHWHDVAVDVPVGWGWGSAPVRGADGVAVLCGDGQVVQADGSRRVQRSLPYVGRPVPLSGRCETGWTHERPRAPYVWLGADLRPGTVGLGGGWTRRTVLVGDVSVTVASDDARLRDTILASARRGTGRCDARLPDPPRPGGTTAAEFVPVSMTVCAYGSTSTRSDYDLLYEQELSMGPAKYLVDAVAHAPGLGAASCYAASGGEWALLRLAGADDTSRDYVVDLSCPGISDPTGLQHVLDAETVTPWAVGGVNAVLHAHPLVRAPGRLIPPAG